MNRFLFRVFFFLSSLLMGINSTFSQSAAYVWSNPEGSGRQQKVLFRNTFDVINIPDTATIFLFGSSRYHIYVNGTHLNFGPSRFYPENHWYDPYNIAPWLVKGKNVLSVEVLANGMETYQIFRSIGSLIAWGSFDAGVGQSVSFETPGTWKMLPVASMDSMAQKYSFACGAQELFDARKEPFQWKQPGFDDSDWQTPVLIDNQDYWGNLQAREIPHLTQDETESFRCLGMYHPLRSDEVYSFYQKTPDENQKLYNQGNQLAGYTWVYSPVKQSLEIGT